MGFLSGIRLYAIAAIAILAIGGFLYIRYQQAEMQTLRANLETIEQQAKDLQAANEFIKNDLAQIQATTAALQSALASVRQTAADAVRQVRQRNTQAAAKADPKKLEEQINTEWQNQIKTLEGNSRAQ